MIIYTTAYSLPFLSKFGKRIRGQCFSVLTLLFFQNYPDWPAVKKSLMALGLQPGKEAYSCVTVAGFHLHLLSSKIIVSLAIF